MIMTWYYRMVILCSLLTVGLADINSLVATSDCICDGQTFEYECTVVGGNLTVWSGTVTGDQCEITLFHDRFNSSGYMRSCRNGAVVGRSVEVINNCYRSQLTISVTPNLNQQTVSCSVDYGPGTTNSIIGTTTLSITTDPIHPPTMLSLNLTIPEKLVLNWKPVNYSCPSLQYNVTVMTLSDANNCGTCVVNSTSSSASCAGFMLESSENLCRYDVRSVICGNLVGEPSSLVINLRVPRVVIQQSIPHYLAGRFNYLIALDTTFTTEDSFSITNEIDGSPINFMITYSDTMFGSLCASDTIQASFCDRGFCNHMFDALTSSSCPTSTDITVKVIATNKLGNGPAVNSSSTDGVNNLVNVNFNQTTRRFNCTFLNPPPNTLKHCTASVMYGRNDCDKQHKGGLLNGSSSADTVMTEVLVPQQFEIESVNKCCFSVNASSDNKTVIIEGTLDVIYCGSDGDGLNLIAAIVVPLFIMVVMIIIIIVVLSLCLWKFRQKTQGNQAQNKKKVAKL